jgi:hypothetical protein
VIFTLFVNATTIKKLLEILGMSEISDSKKIAMANAVKRVQDTTARTFKMLRTDRFLADAHWALAENVCQIQNPYILGGLFEVRSSIYTGELKLTACFLLIQFPLQNECNL